MSGWLSQQPYGTSLWSLDNVAAAMTPFSDAKGVTHYEGFFHLELPGEPIGERLHRASMWRHRPPMLIADAGSGVSVKVVHSFTHLLDHEIETTKRWLLVVGTSGISPFPHGGRVVPARHAEELPLGKPQGLARRCSWCNYAGPRPLA